MLDNKEVEFLKTLVFNELNFKFTGDNIESLMSCGYIHFNIPEADVRFRRNLLSKLMSLKIQSHDNRPFPPNIFAPNTLSTVTTKVKRLSTAQINVISGYIMDQKKLQAIKMLRTYTGLGLKDAKEFIDVFIPSGNIPRDFSYINAANAFSTMCI